jgi:hypothetical protein
LGACAPTASPPSSSAQFMVMKMEADCTWAADTVVLVLARGRQGHPLVHGST